MAEYSIPVDIFNPGQVFASLGFLEAADVLLGDVEGGFDWTDYTNVRFILRTGNDRNPFKEVLEFIANANMVCLAPPNYKTSKSRSIRISECFPSKHIKDKEFPCRFEKNGFAINISHWADSSSRDNFKQFAGNQNPSETILPQLQSGIKELLKCDTYFIENPFESMLPIGRISWKLDARSAWTARDVGYSLEDQKYALMSSPVVELYAAIGFENARPFVDLNNKLKVSYGVWSTVVAPLLCRPVIGGINTGIPTRIFEFIRNKSGKNGEYKQTTYANEVTIENNGVDEK